MSRAPKHTLWAVEGQYYGRVKSFPTASLFLERIYALTPEEDGDDGFFPEWKESHSLADFLKEELPKVQRGWYRWAYFDGGGWGLDDGIAGTKGAFELWTWE